MLTPVDIQQKKFHAGIGYDKKDVNDFFKDVIESYEQLYRSNADLKEQVNTLTDGLQNYKSKESALKKSLMLAEKDSEDTKSRALKEAKNIELDAKNRAKVILEDAEKRLEAITKEVALLETQYAAYKSNFVNLMKMQLAFLKENDFDFDAYADDRLVGMFAGGAPVSQPAGDSGSSFGAFTGDPQMRDESTLGGNSGGQRYNEYGEDSRTSTSAVYTSGLGANENFVDPFNPNKGNNGRYNPFDGRTAKSSSASSSFTVNNGKNGSRKAAGAKKTTSDNTPKYSNSTKTEPKKESTDSSHANQAKVDASVKRDEQYAKEEPTKAPKTEDTKPTEETSIPTINTDITNDTTSTADTFASETTEQASFAATETAEATAEPEAAPEVGDVEDKVKPNDTALLGNGDDEASEDLDDDGFEFV